MIIKEYNKSDLKEALKNNSLWEGDVFPITKHRLISHLHNPRASEDDVLLTISFDDNNFINGYIGTLPDYIYTNSGEQKIAWFSTWWVKPNDKNSNIIGSMLFENAMKSYDNNIGVSGFAPSVEKVYKASRKFISLKKLKCKIIYVGSPIKNLKLIKHPKLSSLYFALSIFDFFINLFMKIKVRSLKIPKDYSLEYINEIDNETSEIIKPFLKNELTKRSKQELDWILKYPWLVNSKDYTENEKYYFSSSAKNTETFGLKIKGNDNSILAFLILFKRDENLKLSYSYFKKEHSNIVLKVLSKECINRKTGILHINNNDLINIINKSNIPNFFSTDIIRKSLISKNYKNDLPDSFILQPGDGDCAFT